VQRMELFTDHGLKLSSNLPLASDATLLVDGPPGGSVQATLHADPMLLMALVSVVALAVAGMALYVVQLAVRKVK